jgi:hypothetical protein
LPHWLKLLPQLCLIVALLLLPGGGTAAFAQDVGSGAIALGAGATRLLPSGLPFRRPAALDVPQAAAWGRSALMQGEGGGPCDPCRTVPTLIEGGGQARLMTSKFLVRTDGTLWFWTILPDRMEQVAGFANVVSVTGNTQDFVAVEADGTVKSSGWEYHEDGSPPWRTPTVLSVPVNSGARHRDRRHGQPATAGADVGWRGLRLGHQQLW